MKIFILLFVFAVSAFTVCEFKSLKVVNKFEYKTLRDGPPDHTEYALMARYVVHKAEWVSMATISTFQGLEGYPFVNILSTADGPRNGKSTGNVYLYMTELDFSGQDLKADNRLTLMISMDQDLYCREHQLDSEDPRCARIMISGKIVKLVNGTEEYEFAKNSLYQRHPIMKTWPQDHSFFFVKVEIASVLVLDWFGGPHSVTPEEYFNATPNDGSRVEDDVTNEFDSNDGVVVDYLLIEADQTNRNQIIKDSFESKSYDDDNSYFDNNESNDIRISMI